MSNLYKYEHPFTLQELEQLAIDNTEQLAREIDRLSHSVQKLKESNDELQQALQEEFDHDLKSAYDENETTIATQQERIQMIKDVIGHSLPPHYHVQ